MAASGSTDDITAEARMAAARVRERAASLPGAAEIAGMAMDGGDMSADEIRTLAADAVRQAEQVAFLLGRLAGLLDDSEPS